jgi:Zn-dependent protease
VLIELLDTNPVFYFTVVIAVLVSVVLHELGHGVAAIWQGDETPRLLGHMTWNPVVHMGYLGLLFLGLFGIAFGRMPVSPARFRGRNGRALVAFAGPAVNLLLALLGIGILAIWVAAVGEPTSLGAAVAFDFFRILAIFNIILAAFNLLPIPPLDGATVLGDLVPRFRVFAANPKNQAVFMVAFILVFLTAWRVLYPAAIFIVDGLTGVSA